MGNVGRTGEPATAVGLSVLLPGDPAPWFVQHSTSNPRFSLSSVGGRYVVLCFFGSASNPAGQAAMSEALANRTRFDDPADDTQGRLRESLPGIRFFYETHGGEESGVMSTVNGKSRFKTEAIRCERTTSSTTRH